MRKRRLQRSDALWLGGVALLLLLQFWWLPGDPGTPDDTYSATIEGKRGFFQILENLSEAGVLPSVRRESRALVPDQIGTLVILSPDRYPNESEQQELTQFIMTGGTLLFAPNWHDPNCRISQLNIDTHAKYFDSEDLVQSGGQPRVAPVAKPAPQASLGPNGQAQDSTASGTDATTGKMTAEAEDPSTSGASSVPAGNTSPSGQMPQNKDDAQSAEDIVKDAMRQGTTLQPPAKPPTDGLETEDDWRRISDFNTSSPLVKGAVPWRTQASMQTGTRGTTVLVRSTSGTPQVAAWKHGSGMVVVSASADVFSNRAMLDQAQAELAIRLVEYAHAHHQQGSSPNSDRPIVISEFLNASDAYRGTAVLIGPSLRSGTLQLMTIAVLAGWFGFHRFGPPRRVNTFQRRSLTESATAVGNLQFRTDSGGEVLSRYLDYFRTRLQRYFGRSVRLEDQTAIAARAGMDVDEVTRRLAGAMTLAGQPTTSSSEAAQSIREVSQILHRLSGGRAER